MKTDYIMGAAIFGFILLGLVAWLINMNKKEWKNFTDAGFHILMIYPIGICLIFIFVLLANAL
jgi:hypothetical protein